MTLLLHPPTLLSGVSLIPHPSSPLATSQVVTADSWSGDLTIECSTDDSQVAPTQGLGRGTEREQSGVGGPWEARHGPASRLGPWSLHRQMVWSTSGPLGCFLGWFQEG